MILYAITNRRLHPGGDLIAQASSLIRSGVDWLQVREKDLSDGALIDVLKILVPEAGRFGTTLLVNGRADIAAISGVAGLHLPSTGVPVVGARRLFAAPKVIAVSCHSVYEAKTAQDQGADAVTLGPVFDTPSKRSYGSPLGLAVLEAACRSLTIPVLGLGGITGNRLARSVLDAGASGIAAIRLFCTMANPLQAVPKLKASLSTQ